MMGQVRKYSERLLVIWPHNMHIKQAGLEVMLQTYIQEVVGSDLGWDTSYCDWGSSWLFLVPQGRFWNTTSTGLWPLSPKSFLIHHLFTYLFIILTNRHYIVSIWKPSSANGEKICTPFFSQALSRNCFYTICYPWCFIDSNQHAQDSGRLFKI
jgi:hypothetical protein